MGDPVTSKKCIHLTEDLYPVKSPNARGCEIGVYINCSGGKSRCFAWGARGCKNRACCSVVVGIRAPKLMAGARIQGPNTGHHWLHTP